MITLGITGGIGCGKTTICKILSLLDIPLFISDIEAKKLMVENHQIKTKLTTILGDKSYFPTGQLNKPYISNLIFNNPKTLELVNKVVHQATKDAFIKWKQQQTSSIVAYESALLFESNSNEIVDKVIYIKAPLEIRIKRVMLRDHISREKVMDRIKNQLDDKIKENKADYIIYNHNRLVIPQIINLINQI
ncbi:dephospho-CoA kinase [Halosquirtibacter xylanolyticus]|uniref:dephospho-CoA kinase n=1 Tax=Halosquirtibacter xylanolyticus TaxID=3374599 RepID=UPI003747A8CC|nr:dephospho-CoA kinase [Prolixibacteraceae bacterium]